MTIASRVPALACCAAALILVIAGFVQAQDLKVGSRYRGSAELSKTMGGIILPLPDGEWQLVTLSDSRASGVDYNLPTKTGGFMALPIDQKRQQIKSLISYWIASTDPMHGGWKEPDVCGDREAYYSYRSPDNRRLKRVQCWSIKLARTQGAKYLPPFFIAVSYFWSDGAKVLNVTYNFNPEIAGFPPLTTETWGKADLSGDPKRVQYVDDLKAWTIAWQTRIDQGFAGKVSP